MKKLTLTLLTALLLVAFAGAQETFTFKPGFSPEKKYLSTISQTSNFEITYSGSAELLQKLEEKGIKNPVTKTSESISETATLTGKVDKGSMAFPLKIEYVSTKNSDNKALIPNGTLIYGHCKVGEKAVLDSISSESLDANLKKAMLDMVQKLMTELNLPEKKLKLGDEFTIENPLNLPMNGINIEMNIVTSYKLKALANGLASFDVDQAYTIKTPISAYKIDASGKGKGNLTYDIKNRFNVVYEINTEMNMSLTAQQLTMALKSTGKHKQTTTISK